MASIASNPESMSSTTQALQAWAGKTLKTLVYVIASLGILFLIWVLIHNSKAEFPDPIITIQKLFEYIANFNNKDFEGGAIGPMILTSLNTVGLGFLLSALVGIPLGILMGSNEFFKKLLNPLVQFLRPVSPIVWFSLGLIIFISSPTSLVFMIFMCSLWPVLINTSHGISTLPSDFATLSKVFKFSAGRYVFSVLLPHTLPYIFTSLRLSFGVGWMVIVAGEALAGNGGIGQFIWNDGYNAGKYEPVICGLIIIGVIGFVIDTILGFLVKITTPGGKS